jgi:phage-related tail fiber protein
MSSAVSKVTLNGDGVQTSWPFSFKVWKAADLEVSITNAAGVTTVVSNWSVSLAGTGGTVTYPTSGPALPSGHKITIARSMDFLQDVDLISGTRWDPEVVETALDRATAERQQLKEKLDRAIVVDVASSTTPEALRDSIFAARDTSVASAASALDSAERAEIAATTATTKADAAAASATTATTKADAAAASATQALDSANAAAASATTATTKANAAAASATQALDSANAAAASATQALDSANAAAASASAAAASFDAFDDRYLGAKPSDPVTDNDGNALQVGALYWNTTANEMRVWNGSSWQASAGSLVGNATTATRLQTPRTLTIGNTGKSFDGSADVSWSLAEIGAAGFGTLADGTDLNKVVSPGFYRLGATHGNEPPYVAHGQLIVARGGEDTILQIVTGHNNGEIYWRQGNPPDVGGSGSWSAWHRFFHSGNLNPTDYAPPGMVAYFARNTAPSGWLKANGAAVSRTTYAALFAAIGTTFGPGDGSTTFNLPDLRGEFLRGWDDGRGVDAGRGFGSSQGDAIRNITGSLVSALLDSVVGTGAFIAEFSDQSSGAGSGGLNKMTGVFDASRVVPTANENRPRNVALLACIKY